jgi:hypothetical protein
VEPPEPSGTTYACALASGELVGTPTYRLPHHPRYATIFNGRAHRTIWARAQVMVGWVVDAHPAGAKHEGAMFGPRLLRT